MVKKLKIAFVRWKDAFSSEELDDDPHCLQYSAGILLQNNRKCVKLALIWDETEARDILTIPRAYVETIEVVHVAKVGEKGSDQKKEKPKRPTPPRLPLGQVESGKEQ